VRVDYLIQELGRNSGSSQGEASARALDSGGLLCQKERGARKGQAGRKGGGDKVPMLGVFVCCFLVIVLSWHVTGRNLKWQG
jgi:hypothetical protein